MVYVGAGRFPHILTFTPPPQTQKNRSLLKSGVVVASLQQLSEEVCFNEKILHNIRRKSYIFPLKGGGEIAKSARSIPGG